MLKICDNVDLKELEKFGLKETIKDDDHIDGYEFSLETKQEYYYLLIPKFNREIMGNALDIIYDLIQANLVEKVSDKNV